jgi:hypothetical protein
MMVMSVRCKVRLGEKDERKEAETDLWQGVRSHSRAYLIDPKVQAVTP